MKLTQKQKTSIQTLLSQKKNLEEISIETGVSQKQITEYIDGELSSLLDHLVNAKLQAIEAEKTALAAKKNRNPLINTTRSGKSGVSIMTEAGSGRGDDIINRGIKKKTPVDHIFKIDPNK